MPDTTLIAYRPMHDARGFVEFELLRALGDPEEDHLRIVSWRPADYERYDRHHVVAAAKQLAAEVGGHFVGWLP